ncbi:hypothetical protein D5074_13335 [Pectobacterium polaris]|nr:hypothetical protein D5074_13335 [Pectobacterium polaris]
MQPHNYRYISVILQAACALAILGSSLSLALKGRRKQRSNRLSRFVLTHPVTYLSKLLGIRSVAAFTQLELFRV